MQNVNYEKKMANFQKNLLLRKLNNIDKIIEHRKYISSIYGKELKKLGILVREFPKDYDVVYLRYPLLVKNKEKILNNAIKKGIEIGDWFVSVVHPITKNLEFSGYEIGSCPIAEKICKNIINLPTHEKIKEKDVKRIENFIKDNIYSFDL